MANVIWKVVYNLNGSDMALFSSNCWYHSVRNILPYKVTFNKTGKVRITCHCGAVVQPVLQWIPKATNTHWEYVFSLCICSLR